MESGESDAVGDAGSRPDAVGDAGSRPASSAWIVAAPDPGAAPRVFGLRADERLRAGLEREGFERIHAGPEPPAVPGADLLVVRGDTLFDERLLAALRIAGPTLLAADGRRVAARVEAGAAATAAAWLDGGPPPPGAAAASPDDLVPAYQSALRKSQPAWALPLEHGGEAALERRLFDASYKGVTDVVTRYLWPPLALPAVRGLARLGVTPNSVTVASWVLVVLAALLFARGQLAAGLAAAWLMTFLDTVDGKLARVTLQSSRIGHVLDHGLDLVHPPFWWWAWGAALLADGPAWIEAAIWITVVGYVVGRLLEGLFMVLFGMEIHSWRRLDSRFRLVTARRNPNLVLLSVATAAGRPDLGLGWVAAWTLASIAFHSARILQALWERRRGNPIRGWQMALLLLAAGGVLPAGAPASANVGPKTHALDWRNPQESGTIRARWGRMPCDPSPVPQRCGAPPDLPGDRSDDTDHTDRRQGESAT